MSSDNAPAQLGFLDTMDPSAGRDDVFDEDDVGVWRCVGCHRSTAEVDEQGHSSECPEGKRLQRSAPKGAKRIRVVGEWVGLRTAIQRDHDLRINLVGAIIRAYRVELDRARKQQRRGTPTRQKATDALIQLVDLLRELTPLHKTLGTLERKVSAWWATIDKLDGRGGPPPTKKKGIR